MNHQQRFLQIRSAGVLPQVLFALLVSACVVPLQASTAVRFQSAPPEISEYLRNSSTPILSFNPQRDHMLIYHVKRYSELANLSDRVVRLAGLEINRDNNGPHRANVCLELNIKPMFARDARDVEARFNVPKNSRMSLPTWSPNGKRFAMMRLARKEVSLYLGSTEGRRRLVRVRDVVLNGALGSPIQWLPDGNTLLCRLISRGENDRPVVRLPVGPNVVETSGAEKILRPYRDLLETEEDADLFDYYTTSQLALVNAETEEVVPIGEPDVFLRVLPSPDGQYLLVTRLPRPYSQELPASSFARQVEIWNRDGELVYSFDPIPERINVPPGGVLAAPRNFHWRPTQSAELVWVEPIDLGDPSVQVSHRDRVMRIAAPFQSNKETEITRTEHRYISITWAEEPQIALIKEYDVRTREYRTFLFNPNSDEEPHELIWDGNPIDRYNDPGKPMMRVLPNGQSVMRVHYNSIYLIGKGASPNGDQPFLDTYNLTTRETRRLFQSDLSSHESVVALLAPDASRMITRRETTSSAPNYYVRDDDGELFPLTLFKDEYPGLHDVHRQLITYERRDGVRLSFVVYLPPDFYDQPPDQRQPLPTLLWAYPRSYPNADLASQTRGSLRRFPTYSRATHRFLALMGYAVLDNTTMPVIGNPSTANDTFIEQIVAGAEAAVTKAVELGFADPDRIAVGGHSYGAFMTANLLAHTDLFRAGIARSGAYNRTLTPFGFQNERRSLWEAPNLYTRLSPLMFANQIDEPLLLIHGEADANPATDPVQSKWMYQAIQGNGGTARLVTLPFESHQYQAVESVEHVIWETAQWLDRYVRNAPDRGVPFLEFAP
ncbi:MAG: hypothetical protein CMO80_03820 [Verrucomicrobiales bacterium]|nr:hypothetical protein [Verrucomicrobiales bacterium]|tara:strand:- start:4396 stop:6897 length:2502 start_codon:yes stop_codon:yes gene_type:complete